MKDELTSRYQRQTDHKSSRKGFNLTELMVVIATIAMLATLWLPALAGTKHQDNSAVCLNNLRQIYNDMMIYAGDNNDTFHHIGGGDISNGGQWTTNPTSTTILAPNAALAYWGVADYLLAVRAAPAGHLVIATLHTGSCRGVLERFLTRP